MQGTYGELVLFGVMPAAMVWSERNQKTIVTQIRVAPAGNFSIICVFGFAMLIIIRETLQLISQQLNF